MIKYFVTPAVVMEILRQVNFMTSIYESERLLAEYLLFHYGSAKEILTDDWGAELAGALDFPARCARLCLDLPTTGRNASALDVGCAVGRTSFELTRTYASVIGIDSSSRFVKAAETLKTAGELAFDRVDEGARMTMCVARVPPEIRRERVFFETGDAMDLGHELGSFDLVLAANLLCRLAAPAKFLTRLSSLVKPRGWLVITTPCTWLEEFTPRINWLCNEKASTLEGVHCQLDPHFILAKTCDLPFVIREHARKFQCIVAQATAWQRK